MVDALAEDQPVVYVNPAFEALTGYPAADLLGKNLRLLQGDDREQDGRHRLREALKQGESCRVLLRNYRKDGSLFWNELTVLPLRDADGRVTHFAGHHRDAGDRLRIDLQELLKRDWAIAQREKRSIAVFAIDIDSLDLYNATFGRAAGDSAIRRVSHCISGCLRRSSDVTARIDGGSLMAFAPGLTLDQALALGHVMAERVRELRIHHPRSGVLRYVSVSVGVCAAVPEADDNPAALVEKSQLQLKLAKKAGRNRAA
jgi:diguanylate cyclase (GGDEF)-like protein/PAS domain S-box-containing protein